MFTHRLRGSAIKIIHLRRWSPTVVPAAIALSLVLAAAPALAAPGDLDPSFGAGGRVTLDLQQSDFGFGGALAPDGKILVVGDTNFPADRNPGIARFTPSGAPDPAFGGGAGLVTAGPSPTDDDFTKNVQLQSDGKIVVGGSFDGAAGILRHRTDGLPDTGFDGDGIVKTEFGHYQRAGGILLLPDGRILWFGRGNYFGGKRDLDIARYEADGSLDAGFGIGGLVSHSLRPGSDNEEYSAALLQTDGKILVGGSVYSSSNDQDWAIARLDPSGSFDTSFDGDGVLMTKFADDDFLHGLALQPDGKIVAAGGQDGTADIAVARYLPDGSLDPTFDGDGKRVIDLGGDETGRAVAVQPDGKILVAGHTDAAGGDTDMVVSRLLSDGTLDPGFGVSGTKFVDFAGGNDEAHDLHLQPDGKAVAVGWATISGYADFAAIRLEGEPQVDSAAPPSKDNIVSLRILGRRVRVNRRGVAHLRLRCPTAEQSPPCRGRVVLRTRARVRFGARSSARRRRLALASARFRLAAGATGTARLRLGARKLRLLRHAKKARRVVAIARVRDAAGNRATVRKRLRAVPKRGKRSKRSKRGHTR